jgi:Phage integrase, N-terminal SAM-like domain
MARAKRRPNREGSIWRRQDGRWTGAAYVLTASGILKRTYVYGRTREEAHAKLVQLQDRSARGIPRPDRAWRVGEYLDYWLTEVAKPAVRPTTYAKYEVMVRLYLRPALGHHRLDRLSVVAVQDYLNGRCGLVTRSPRCMSSAQFWPPRSRGPCVKISCREMSPAWLPCPLPSRHASSRGAPMRRAGSYPALGAIRSMRRSC